MHTLRELQKELDYLALKGMCTRILNCLNQMSVRSHLIVKLMSYLGHKN
jgi:hypothetical protein